MSGNFRSGQMVNELIFNQFKNGIPVKQFVCTTIWGKAPLAIIS